MYGDRTIDRMLGMTLGQGWERVSDCCRKFMPPVPSEADLTVDVEAEYHLPGDFRAYNMARIEGGLCFTTHMGTKRLLFLDNSGRFTIGPSYEDKDVSMVCVGRRGSALVLAPIGSQHLEYRTLDGQPLWNVDLSGPWGGTGPCTVWRHCSLDGLELVVMRGQGQVQTLLAVEPEEGRVARIADTSLLMGVTNRVRFHDGQLFFLQNLGPHLLVARLDMVRPALRCMDIKPLSGCAPMGLDVSSRGMTVGWNNRLVQYGFDGSIRLSGSFSGYESMDLLEAEGEGRYWLRSPDFRSIFMIRFYTHR